MDFREVIKTEESRKNFVKGLIHLSKVDGVISEEESQYYIGACYNLGLKEEDIAEIQGYIYSNDAINIEFKTMKEKILFFREAIQLCSVDGIYDTREKLEIRKMAEQLQVSTQIIEEIESWVDEGMVWKDRGDLLLELGGEK